MDLLIAYINRNITSPELKKILLSMAAGTSQLHHQCAYNILIDLKYRLIPENYYEDLSRKTGDLQNFVSKLEKQFFIKCKSRSFRYSTITTSNIYNKYLRPGGISTGRKRFDEKRIFNEDYIKTYGWIGYKDSRFTPIAWVTPHGDLINALGICRKDNKNSSNFIHEYIGVLTNRNFKDYLQLSDTEKVFAVVINYSDEVPVELFHPNCTIPYGWNEKCSNNIFLSFGNPMDEYGRTFNLLDTGPAKERIHKNHTHFDKKYEIEEMTDEIIFEDVTVYNRTQLLIKAQERLSS